MLQGRKDVQGYECFVIQEVLLNDARWKQTGNPVSLSQSYL